VGIGSLGAQPHTFAVPPPPQLWFAEQVPHEMGNPQLSLTVPQFLPAQGLPLEVQPHTPVVPLPPHVCGGVHVPQLPMVCPHAFPADGPQFRPLHEGGDATVMEKVLTFALSPDGVPSPFTALPCAMNVIVPVPDAV
jgi:hypothetical protein